MRRLLLALVFLLTCSGVASPAMAVSEQTLVGHTLNWLDTKGFDIDPVTLVTLPNDYQDTPVTDENGHLWLAPGYAIAVSIPGRLVFRLGGESYGGLTELANRYGERRGPLSPSAVRGAQLLLHEIIHQLGLHDPADGWLTATAEQRYFEEGTAESVARDLLPSYLAYMFGHKYREPRTVMAMESETKRLRAVSTFGASTAAGLGKWNKPAAIAWRGTFARAAYSVRATMLADAAAKQAAKAWL